MAIQRLAAGESAMLAEWPLPPEGLVALPLEAGTARAVRRGGGRSARADRRRARERRAIRSRRRSSIYRQVHTLKGAGSAVGDEPMTWFCHGLEERLRLASASRDAATQALQEVARWRGVLGGLVEDPESALRTLRATYGAARRSARSRVSSRRERAPVRRRSRPRVGDAKKRPCASRPRRSTG